MLVPFDVPIGIQAIRLALRHDPPGDADRPEEGAVVDLGLIAPGPTTMGTEAFRGWSGSERTVITVGQRRATPGYRPGPIAAGTWHAILGLYAIPATGCRYWVDIELLWDEPGREEAAVEAHPPGPTPRPGRAIGRPDARRWFACDLHAHSVHSDGVDELAELAAAAGRLGLDVVFATDHNTTSHHPFLDGATAAGGAGAAVLLPGEEVTTYRGHMNALGATGWIDFRHRSADDVAGAIDTIHAHGGLASINHPRRNPCGWTWGNVPMDLVEVWNGPWSDANEASLAWWYELVAAGIDGLGGRSPRAGSPSRPPTSVGGSDCHGAASARPLATPTTWVLAAATTREAIVAGLAACRVAVTASPAAKPPDIRRTASGLEWDLAAAAGQRLIVRSADGVILERSLESGDRGHQAGESAQSRTSPVAAEIRGPADELVALVPLLIHGG